MSYSHPTATASVTLADFADDALTIEGTYGRAHLAVTHDPEADTYTLEVQWQEGLDFHRGRQAAAGDAMLEGGELAAHLETRLSELLPTPWGEAVTIWWDDEFLTDMDVVEFQVARDGFPGNLTLEDAWDVAWPAIAALFNITDPGTFGSEYLFRDANRG